MDLGLNEQNSEYPVRDFRTWFQREFLKRRKKNESYSVRAFSNYLKLASATVSHLLSGKRKPSTKFVSKLFTQLEVNPKERDLILASLKNKKENVFKKNSLENKYEMIALDAFKLMADWNHYAILELTSVQGFKFDYPWIANQLSISVTEARQAVERLLRLDLVEEKRGSRQTPLDIGLNLKFLYCTCRPAIQRSLLASMR